MRSYRHDSHGDHEFPETGKSGRVRISEVFAYGLAGLSVAVAVAVTGHYLGQQASAHTAMPEEQWSGSLSPAPTIASKGSLLVLRPQIEPQVQIRLASLRPQIAAGTKADFEVAPEIIKPQDKLARLNNLIVTPTVSDLERNWKVGKERKSRIMAERKKRLAGMTCLARAIYFEARSESELGQLAVAKVIMNRVNSPAYPDSICDVVYQGAQRKNSCQFSFACDGSPDVPRAGRPWTQAQQVAKRAINGASDVRVISTATHYHAEYVNPRWTGTMTRLIKIGKHIFYNGG